jgi:hypothetical protein
MKKTLFACALSISSTLFNVSAAGVIDPPELNRSSDAIDTTLKLPQFDIYGFDLKSFSELINDRDSFLCKFGITNTPTKSAESAPVCPEEAIAESKLATGAFPWHLVEGVKRIYSKLTLQSIADNAQLYTAKAFGFYADAKLEAKARVFKVCSAMKLSDRNSTSINQPTVANDPIRSRSLLDDFALSELTGIRYHWANQVYKSVDDSIAIQRGLELLDQYIAASESYCSAIPTLEPTATDVADQITVAGEAHANPINDTFEFPSFVIRKIPIDYSFATANDVDAPLTAYIEAPDDVESIFGSHVFPNIKFAEDNFLTTTDWQQRIQVALDEIIAELRNDKWLDRRIEASTPLQAVRTKISEPSLPLAWRVFAARGVQSIRSGLSGVQNALQGIESYLINSDTEVGSTEGSLKR